MKRKESRIKLPLKEWAYIWLDRFARGEYEENIYNDAYHYLTVNVTVARGMPHFLAMTALYTSCVHNNIELKLDKHRKVLKAYLGERKGKAGVSRDSQLIYLLKKSAKTWKQIPPLK